MGYPSRIEVVRRGTGQKRDAHAACTSASRTTTPSVPLPAAGCCDRPVTSLWVSSASPSRKRGSSRWVLALLAALHLWNAGRRHLTRGGHAAIQYIVLTIDAVCVQTSAPPVKGEEEEPKEGGIFCGMNLIDLSIFAFMAFLFVFFVVSCLHLRLVRHSPPCPVSRKALFCLCSSGR